MFGYFTCIEKVEKGFTAGPFIENTYTQNGCKTKISNLGCRENYYRVSWITQHMQNYGLSFKEKIYQTVILTFLFGAGYAVSVILYSS